MVNMSPTASKTAIVIPAYNAAAHLPAVLAGVHGAVPNSPVIVVDDGSTDGTGDVARSGGAVVVTHGVNRGKGAALVSGATKAIDMDMDYVVTLDADGQHDPAEIPKFMDAAARTGADVLIGNRMENRRDMPFIRVFANRVTSAFVSLRTGQKIPDSQNGYRMLKTDVFRHISLETQRYDAESEILIKAAGRGGRIYSVPVQTIYGEEVSSVHPFVDTLRFFRLVFRSLFW